MGKTKSARRREFRLQNPLNDAQQSSNRVRHRPQDLEENQDTISSDISSLDDSKRLRACRLLNTVFISNLSNMKVLNALTSPELLSKLSMRLADSSVAVQHEAIGVIRNLAVSASLTIIQRIIDCGILNIILTITINNIGQISESNCNLSVQLLSCLTNLVAAHEICASAVCQRSEQLLPLVLRLFQSNVSTELDLAIANFLFTLTDNFDDLITVIIRLKGHDVLLTKLSALSVFLTSSSELNMAVLSNLLVCVKCVGALVNMSSANTAQQSEVLNGCGISLFSMLTAFLNSEGNVMKTIKYLFQQSLQAQAVVSAPALSTSTEIDGEMYGVDQFTGASNPVKSEEQAGWNLSIEILQVASEVLANVAVFVASVMENENGSESENAYADVSDDENDEARGDGPTSASSSSSLSSSADHKRIDGVGRFGASAAANLATHPTLIGWNAALTDRSVSIVVGDTLGIMIEMFCVTINYVSGSSAAAIGSGVSNGLATDKLLDIIDCLDRLNSCSGNVLSTINPKILSFPKNYPLDQFGIADSVLDSIVFSAECSSLWKDFLLLFGRNIDRLLAFDEFLSNKAQEIALSGGSEPIPSDELAAEAVGSEGQQKASNNGCSFIDESEIEDVRSSLSQTIVSALNGLCSVIRVGDNRAIVSNVVELQDRMLLQTISLAICKGTLHSNGNVSLASLQAISALSGRDNENEAVAGMPSAVISSRLNALFTNAVCKKLDHTLQSLVQFSTAKAVNMTTVLDHMSLLDSVCIAIIDLHTSDSPELFNNFIRLQVLPKLQATLPIYDNVLSSLIRVSKGKKAIIKLDKAQKGKFEETLENINNFIAYKQSQR